MIVASKLSPDVTREITKYEVLGEVNFIDKNYWDLDLLRSNIVRPKNEC